MISLIINADDLGINPDRDRGIHEAFRHGLVTSSSLLANGPTFETAVRHAGETGLPVGVHLNLSDGWALSGPIDGLTDAEGRFSGKLRMRQHLLAGDYDQVAVQREFAAQIERLLRAGLQPDHLDGHQHCQVFPPLTGIIAGLARDYGIGAMRSSLPAEAEGTAAPGLPVDEMELYRRLGSEAHATIVAAGIRVPRGLWGMPCLHSLNTDRLCALLEVLPDGCWELMTHPGYPHPAGRSFEGEQRRFELAALLSVEARQVVERRRIRLISFRELPCAS